GAKPLAGFPDETVTEGLDGLRDRLSEYRTMGARFAKWRAVIRVTDALPSSACVSANAHALARYAALCRHPGALAVRAGREPFRRASLRARDLLHPASPLCARLRRLHCCPGRPRNPAGIDDDLAALADASSSRHPACFRRSYVEGPG